MNRRALAARPGAEASAWYAGTAAGYLWRAREYAREGHLGSAYAFAALAAWAERRARTVVDECRAEARHRARAARAFARACARIGGAP